MYGVTAEFKDLIRKNHKAVSKAEVWDGDNRLAELEVLEGQVEDDSRRAVRRTCTVKLFSPGPEYVETNVYANYGTLNETYANYLDLNVFYESYGSIALVISTETTKVDNGIVPDDAFDLLAPFGNELRLWRGVRVEYRESLTYSDIAGDYATYTDIGFVSNYGLLTQSTETVTEDELVPLGVFVITDVDVEETEGGVNITLSGQDRSLRVARNRWTDTYTVASGTNVVTAITKLLQDRYDAVQTSFAASTETVGKTVFGTETDNNPWADARKLARSAGLDLYFDGDGVAVLEPVPSYDDATAQEVYAENDEAMVLGVKRSLTTEQTYNGVIAIGTNSNSDTIYRAEVWDDDPSSPTYRYGKFGKVPRFYTSPMLQSTAAATKAANAILTKSKGAQENISWTQIVDPSLESGDLIQVDNTATKVNQLLIIDRLTLPLNVNQAMACTARTIRTMTDDEVI